MKKIIRLTEAEILRIVKESLEIEDILQSIPDDVTSKVSQEELSNLVKDLMDNAPDGYPDRIVKKEIINFINKKYSSKQYGVRSKESYYEDNFPEKLDLTDMQFEVTLEGVFNPGDEDQIADLYGTKKIGYSLMPNTMILRFDIQIPDQDNITAFIPVVYNTRKDRRIASNDKVMLGVATPSRIISDSLNDEQKHFLRDYIFRGPLVSVATKISKEANMEKQDVYQRIFSLIEPYIKK